MDVASLILVRLPAGYCCSNSLTTPVFAHVSAECRLADIQCVISNDLHLTLSFHWREFWQFYWLTSADNFINVTTNAIFLHVKDCFGPQAVSLVESLVYCLPRERGASYHLGLLTSLVAVFEVLCIPHHRV